MINRLIVSTTYEPYEPASPVFGPITAEAPPLSIDIPSPEFSSSSIAPISMTMESSTTTPIYPGGGVAIPESVANAWRNGNRIPFDNWVNGINTPPWTDFVTSDQIINVIVNSPVPVSEPYAGRIEYIPTGLTQYIFISYAGYEKQPTSVPGTVIVETAPPAPVMPVPPMPQILPQIQQTIIDSINQPMEQAQQAIDQVTGTAQGQLEYQLQQVQAPLQRIQSKIESNIVNTMGEVYQEAYPVGLGIPTPEQIIAGEPVYSPYGIGADIPYAPTPPQTTPPGVTCPAPVVQCPDPPDITFSPNIVVNIPQQDGSRVSVEVKAPTPTPTPTPTPMVTMEPTAPTEPSPTEPSPNPSPLPSPKFILKSRRSQILQAPTMKSKRKRI